MAWLVWLGVGVPGGAAAAWVWRDGRWAALGVILGPAVVIAAALYRTNARSGCEPTLDDAVAGAVVGAPAIAHPATDQQVTGGAAIPLLV